MNKIEEVLQGKGITPTTKYHNYEYLYKTIQESMMEFGRLAFDAGAATFDDDWGVDQFKFKTYGDFLKEIENERD